MFVMHLLRRASRAGHRLATRLVALLRGGTVGRLLIDRARQALRDDILHFAAADLAISVAAGYMFGVERDARALAGSSKLRTAAGRGDLPLTTPELERWLPQHPDLIGVGIADLAGVTRATGAWGCALHPTWTPG